MQAYRNSVPVPRHWSQKRKYLQGKRGIEKPPFVLPDFIEATGIGQMRQAYQVTHSVGYFPPAKQCATALPLPAVVVILPLPYCLCSNCLLFPLLIGSVPLRPLVAVGSCHLGPMIQAYWVCDMMCFLQEQHEVLPCPLQLSH